MSANVIEITLRGKDETQGLSLALGKIKASLVGIVAGIGAGVAFKSLVASISSAQKVASNLDSAFENVSKTVGVTRGDLDDLATSIQNTTTVAGSLVKEAETVLLTFQKVNNDAFERTIRVATDMSQRLGTDLVEATRSLGIALSDPEKALSRLQRSGVVFNDEVKTIVKNLVEAGENSRAQSVILTELENKFRGAAAAARNTLGGALEGLKNAFGDLFEGTKEGTSGAVDAINGLSKALSDPKFKGAVDSLVTGLAKVVELAVKGTSAIVGLFKTADLKSVSGVDAKIAEVEAEIAKRGRRQVGRGGFTSGEDPTAAPVRLRGGAPANLAAYIEDLKTLKNIREQLANTGKNAGGNSEESAQIAVLGVSEVQIKNVKKELGAYAQLLQDLNQATKTNAEQQVEAYYQMKEALILLRKEGVITQQQFEGRLGEAIDESLMIDIEPIRAMYKDVRSQTTELGEFMKGVWRSAGEAIRQTLADAVYEGKLSLRSLVDIGRRVVADLIAAFLSSGLKNAFTKLFTGAGGGTGFWGSLAAAFGFSAGGGKSTRPRWVGEEGRELVVPGRGGMSVYNQRQLAGMGGGGITYSPVTNLTLIERENPDDTKREILEVVALQNSKQMAELQRTLSRSGVEARF